MSIRNAKESVRKCVTEGLVTNPVRKRRNVTTNALVAVGNHVLHFVAYATRIRFRNSYSETKGKRTLGMIQFVELKIGQQVKLTENRRFVYLENCGHIIHRESMDRWMSQKDEVSGSKQIKVKRCPKCNTIITRCVRYGDIIKKQFKDVLGIRKKIFGNDETQKRIQQNIARKIQSHSNNQECQFENVREFLERKIFVMKQIKIKNNYRMDLQMLDVSVIVVQLNCCEIDRLTCIFRNRWTNIRSKVCIISSVGGKRLKIMSNSMQWQRHRKIDATMYQALRPDSCLLNKI